MAEFKRPKEGYTFAFNGMKTNAAPETIPPDKSVLAVNVRGYSDTHLRTRPGFTQTLSLGASPVTDIATSAGLQTDNLPVVFSRLANDAVYRNGSLRTTLNGGGVSPGATMISFRPNQSPDPYVYIANGQDYRKLSVPFNIVDPVGLPEPQGGIIDFAPDAAPDSFNSFEFTGVAANWAQTGTAGAPSNSTRTGSDTVILARQDPASVASATPRWSVQVSSGIVYAPGMTMTIGSVNNVVVQDVLPPVNSGGALTIQGIYYFNQATLTGLCVVVPQQTATDDTVPDPATLPSGSSIYTGNPIAGLRRGSLIKFSGSNEVCFVQRVQRGPNGTYSIVVSTTITHTTAETMTGVAAIVVQSLIAPTGAISTPDIVCNVTTGIAKITKTFATSPFRTALAPSTSPAQANDYFHFTVAVASLAALTELKVLFDVGGGSFLDDFYYISIRPNDIAAGVSNLLSQLGVAQLVTQRRIIDEEKASEANNQGTTASSYQSSPIDGAFAEIWIPINEFTRVGSNQSRSLADCTKIQVMANVSAGTQFTIASMWVGGGGQVDTGQAGPPYSYRFRKRNSLTGVKSNPSPASPYGVTLRRQQALVSCPVSLTFDSSYDTIDIFRYGGTVTSWRYVGSLRPPSSAIVSPVVFIDNISDEVVARSEQLDFDNYEPWPSIDRPYSVSANSIIGTTAVVPFPGSALSNLLRYLPGNLVEIDGQFVYTLRCRPTEFTPGQVLLQFEENAGVRPLSDNAELVIYEPAIAQQRLPYMWGPDSYGTVFACGDPLRPGTVSFAKPNNPDAAPDKFNLEIVPPSEPLLGGEVLDGLSFVASTERWWALYPQLSNPVQRYAPIQQPIPRGLAAPWGHCTDGREIFFWAKDGIWSHRQGSLTDADLYNLFPHEGIPGEVVSLYGYSILPPDYAHVGTFRLTHSNGFLYAIYKDTGGTYRCLTYDLRRKAWCVDEYRHDVSIGGIPTLVPGLVSALCHVDQQEGSGGIAQPMLLAGTISGTIGAQADRANDFGTSIRAQINTFEWDGGDLRFGGSIWGDVVLDATLPAGISITPTQEQISLQPVVNLPVRAIRDQNILSLGGGLIANFFGLALTWTDNFDSQFGTTELHLWQPSFLDKPETIADRFADWDDAGSSGNKWWQGFVLHADTDGANKLLAVRDADSLALHPFTPVVNHNGESQKAYSFNQPFLAHMVRIEPLDQVNWRFYESVWVTEPSPEFAETWQTQGTAHGMLGYMHVKQVSVAYSATAPVTLTITSYDGQSPVPIVLPSTSGIMFKITKQLTPNKGQLYFYKATSPEPFQLFLPDWEIMVGVWQRGDAPYTRYQSLGGNKGDQAKI